VPPAPETRRGIGIGELAPEFELAGPCGAAASLSSLRSPGLPVVLLFLSAGCGSCRELHPHLHRWQITLAEHVTLVAIVAGNEDAALELCTEHGVDNVLFDEAAAPLWHTFHMPGTPSGVVVAPDGHVASASVSGAGALEELVRQTIRNGLQTAEAWKQPSPVA
jgi:thiol-disulfide isomerase/thioredoxin